VDEELESAERFRARASDVRAKAKQITTPEIRAMMLEAAGDYEMMARTMEIIHRSKIVLARHQISN
jgi:hypothetical protein